MKQRLTVGGVEVVGQSGVVPTEVIQRAAAPALQVEIPTAVVPAL
jgi:hypothetical protein